MPLTPGTRLSSYEILESIGAGGMGEVYLAKDHKLGRDVAIKVLREELASDPERLRRFEQEARSASALNHPNIITIYDIGKHDSTPYIAMEYVEGKTLREMLSEGPLPTKKLLQLTTQIAEGLAKAHSAGIVHRDLKPENIMVSGDGFVKILDFGLAKLYTPPADADSELVTMEKAGTSPGVVMGTAGYMSPEQAKGPGVDYRADQFAFGAILYEMVTGKRAFRRETGAETISAVLRDEPQPLVDTHPNLHPHLRVIVERCLAKNAEERYAATLDLAKDLKSVELAPSGPQSEKVDVTAETPPRRWPRRPAIIGVVIAALALFVGLYTAGLWDRSPDEMNPRRIESLVVLPLDNLSGDPDQEYFADGMTEVLTSDLAKISAIKVISRTSAMRYKGTDKPLPEIARELNVDGVIEGSVMRAGDRVRITAQLIEAATDQHVWSESYERDLREVLSLQSEVAQAIAREVEAKLTAKEESLLMGGRTVNPEAYEANLRGRYHLDRRSGEDIRKSIEYFEKAIDIDPNYTGGYSGLAAAYLNIVVWGYSPRFDLGPEEALSKAKTAALKGVELDDTDAGTHASLGWVRLFTWEWAAAEQEFKKAIELNPGLALAHWGYANYLRYFGDQQESLAEIELALELDPLSISINDEAASLLLSAGHSDEAIEQSRKTLELNPNLFNLHGTLAFAYKQKGLHEEAVEEWKKTFTLFLGSSAVAEVMETGYAKSGYEGAMLAGAQKIEELSRREYVKPFFVAMFYAEAEQKDAALRWLEKAYEERDFLLVSLKTEKRWDLLRSDPRFQDLLRRMNFPE